MLNNVKRFKATVNNGTETIMCHLGGIRAGNAKKFCQMCVMWVVLKKLKEHAGIIDRYEEFDDLNSFFLTEAPDIKLYMSLISLNQHNIFAICLCLTVHFALVMAH